MSYLLLTPAELVAEVDRQLLVPLLLDADALLSAVANPGRAVRRRLKATKRTTEGGLRPFRIN